MAAETSSSVTRDLQWLAVINFDCLFLAEDESF